jgi:thiol:disulfide interchange protein DsbD
VKRARALCLTLAWALALAAAARAQAPDVRVSAIPEYTAVHPGGTFRVAVRLRLPAGWHIGWLNPGAGGLATTIAWHVPAGLSGGTTEWPYPETDDAGGEISHVYRGTVVLFSSFAVGTGVAGPVELSGDLNWGICRIVCVQQHHTVTITVPVARDVAARSSMWAEAAAAMRLLPMRERSAGFDAIPEGDSVRLAMTGLRAGPAPGSWVTFFPLEPGRRSVVVPVRTIPGGIAVLLPRAVVSGAPTARLSGVLVAAHAPGAPPPMRALAVDVPVTK